MRFPSLLWDIGSVRSNQRPRKQNLLLIRCSQSCLRNRSCSLMTGQEIILLRSFFRKTSGLRLALTVRQSCWLLCSRPWRVMLDFSGSTTVYLACGVTDLRKSYTGLAAIVKLKTKIPSRSVFPLYVRILQSQTHIDQNPPVGRIRILDSDETAWPGRIPLAGYPGWIAEGNIEGDPLAMWWFIPKAQRCIRGTPPEDRRIKPYPVNSQKAENPLILRGFSSIHRSWF